MLVKFLFFIFSIVFQCFSILVFLCCVCVVGRGELCALHHIPKRIGPVTVSRVCHDRSAVAEWGRRDMHSCEALDFVGGCASACV